MIEATGTPDRNRVVETTCAPGEQGGNPDRGTGYLITPGLVLTVRHTIAAAEDHPDRIQVRQLSRERARDWLEVRKVITPATPDLDLSLLLLAGDAEEITDDPGVTAGIIDLATPLPFHACGFPKAHRGGEKRGDETARGYIRPDSESRAATVPLDVTTAVPSAGRGTDPAPGEQRSSSWSGMSGAAVIGPGRLLVGVAQADHLKFQANRLEMIPVEALLADEELAPHLPAAWHARPVPRVSNEVPLSIGPRRVHLDAPTPRRHVAQSGAPRVTTLLDSRSQIVPFIPRPLEQEWLRHWCETDPQPVSYAVLSGPGGAGKSRLARRLCDDLANEGWITGIVKPAAGAGFAAPFENTSRPALLVVDYADHRQDELAELLDLLVTAGSAKVRVLAVVREGLAFLRRLRLAQIGKIDDFGDDRHLALSAHPLSEQEREQHYRAATRAFADARHLDLSVGPGQPELAARLAAMTTPLLVHAAALLDLLAASADADAGAAGAADPEDVLRHLLDREDRNFWSEDFAGFIDLDEMRRRVVAVATLVSVEHAQDATNKAEAHAALEAADSPAPDRDRLVMRMKSRYGRWLPRVEPDLLGEQLIADSVVRQGLLATVIDTVTSASQRSRLLEVLLRMCGSPIESVERESRQALADVLDDRLRDLLEQAIAVTAGDADPGSEARALPSRLGACVELVGTPRVAADVLESLVFPERVAVQALAASVYVTAARHAEARRDYAAASDLETKAAAARARAGQLEAAQASIDQAMVYLSSAPSMSVGAGKPLARVLSVGSLVSTGLSRPGIALRDALRSMRIVEELAEEDPGGQAAALLEARVSLIVAYLTADQIDDALATARLAIAESPPGIGQNRTVARMLEAQILQGRGDLAGALDVIDEGIAETPDAPAMQRGAELTGMHMFRATMLSSLGRVEEANQAAQDAEEIALRGRVAGVDESAYVLAQTQIGAATVVVATDVELALDMARRASDALRDLLQQAPDAYGPYYALAETLYAKILDAIGDKTEARRVALGAARLIRDGFATRPAPYLGALFMSALTLAEIHVGEDDYAAAVKVLTETHCLLSRLDPSVVPLAEGNCATLLRCLADVEMAREDYEAAAVAARRALEAFDALVAKKPTVDYMLGHIGTRLLLLFALSAADRDEELADEAAEVLADAGRLMETMPSDQSRIILGLARVIVAESYQARGNVPDAVALLRTALADLHFDHETDGTEDERAAVRRLIRELEAPGELTAADASPERFEDLVPARHSVILGTYRGAPVAARPFRPVLVLGPQRSRKTTGVIIPALLEWEGPVLVTSVRDDVVMGSIARRERMGGKTWVFEPFGELFSGGSALTTWNPVDGCQDWEAAVRMAHALTESGNPQQSGIKDDKWWYSQATLLLGPLLNAAALSRLSMEEVSRWARTGERAEVHARLQVGGARQEAVKTFQVFSDLVDATRDGVYATLRNVLRAYESEAVRRNSRTGFQPDEFFNGEPNTLYMCAPPHEQELLAPIFTALVQTVITHAYKYQSDNLNLLLLLDEAGNIARIDNLNTIATTAAGTRIQLVTVFHDLSQMEALYDQARASNIANNHSALLILPGSRDEATMHLADRLLKDEAGLARYAAQRSIRLLKPGTALCVYEHLKIEEITLRSSTHDEKLIELAKPDMDISGLVTPNRRGSGVYSAFHHSNWTSPGSSG
jgi:hypothetical protein